MPVTPCLTFYLWPPLKLFQLMSVLESDIYSHIITWSPDGKSFVFLDSNAFERIVLPSIFKVAKFDSFLRKVSSNNIINYRSCAAWVLFLRVNRICNGYGLLSFSKTFFSFSSSIDGGSPSVKHTVKLDALLTSTRYVHLLFFITWMQEVEVCGVQSVEITWKLPYSFPYYFDRNFSVTNLMQSLKWNVEVNRKPSMGMQPPWPWMPFIRVPPNLAETLEMLPFKTLFRMLFGSKYEG